MWITCDYGTCGLTPWKMWMGRLQPGAREGVVGECGDHVIMRSVPYLLESVVGAPAAGGAWWGAAEVWSMHEQCAPPPPLESVDGVPEARGAATRQVRDLNEECGGGVGSVRAGAAKGQVRGLRMWGRCVRSVRARAPTGQVCDLRVWGRCMMGCCRSVVNA